MPQRVPPQFFHPSIPHRIPLSLALLLSALLSWVGKYQCRQHLIPSFFNSFLHGTAQAAVLPIRIQSKPFLAQ
jgi:hypothetical protein